MNLPNAITIARILIAPLIAALPFVNSPLARIAAFCLFVIAAVSDYIDGMLARSRNLITDLGRLLDPLADKLLLFATMTPMYILMSPAGDPFTPTSHSLGGAHGFPFLSPFGRIYTPWWIFAIVIGRELFMTAFRQLAARRGVVIAAIGGNGRSIRSRSTPYSSMPRKVPASGPTFLPITPSACGRKRNSSPSPRPIPV